MKKPARPPLICLPTPLLPRLLALLACACVLTAQAELADQNKPLNIASEKGGRIDVANQRTEFNGDVVLSKGSLVLRAEKIDLRETGDGYYKAFASGLAGKPVTFRQARDVPGEAIEGFADQLEYDTRADTVRFVGNAVVRRTIGAAVADEVTGAVIVFDNRAEVFTLEGGRDSPHPTGRARVVMMPRGAAAAAGAAAETPASAVPLRPSLTLTPRKPS